MSYLIIPLGFIFVLGTAVVLHEFGHFIVAKLFKIRVETFSVGFGPRLFGKKWGHTDYRVSAIPLGGYVKLGGDESNAPLEGASAQDIPPQEMYNLRPRWQRIMPLVIPRCGGTCLPGARMEKNAVSMPGIWSSTLAVTGHRLQLCPERKPKP